MEPGEAEVAQEPEGIPLEVPRQGQRVEAHARRADRPLPEADEGEDERQLEGVGEVVRELEPDVVEPEGEARGHAQERRRPYDREQAEHEAQREAQGQPLRGEALREKGHEGVAHPPPPEAGRDPGAVLAQPRGRSSSCSAPAPAGRRKSLIST